MIMNVLCVYNTLYNRSKQIRSSDAQAHSHSHRIEKWKLIVCMFLFLLYTIWTSRSYSRTINIHTVKARHTIHSYRSSFIRFFVLFFFLLLLFGHSCTLQNTNTSQFTIHIHFALFFFISVSFSIYQNFLSFSFHFILLLFLFFKWNWRNYSQMFLLCAERMGLCIGMVLCIYFNRFIFSSAHSDFFWLFHPFRFMHSLHRSHDFSIRHFALIACFFSFISYFFCYKCVPFQT